MKRLLIYVHFNKFNLFSEHIYYQLNQISPLFSKVVFISNSSLSDQVINKLKKEKLVSDVIQRENIGFDFAAWRDAVEVIGIEELKNQDSVTFMNDTCFGPLWDMMPYYCHFEECEGVDFWGITNHASFTKDDFHIDEHLQSYFMVFKKRVVASDVFQEFWEKVQDFNNIQAVIDHYETKLTKLLVDAGFKYDAVLNTNSIAKDLENPNASMFYPKMLLDSKVPFIKVKLCELHQHIAPYIIEDVAEKSSYPVNLIIEHLTAIYPPDSIYKLNYKYLKNYSWKVNTPERKVAIHLHVSNIGLLDRFITICKDFKFHFDVFITVNSEEMIEAISAKFTKNDSFLKGILHSETSNAMVSMLRLKHELSQYDYIGHMDLGFFAHLEPYAEQYVIKELYEMMVIKGNDIINAFEHEEHTGIVIADLPSYFRYRKLIDADSEKELTTTMKQIWEELDLKKAIDFSHFDTFVTTIGGYLWFKFSALSPLFDISFENERFLAIDTQANLLAALERLPIYIAWSQNYDFRISPTALQITPFVDNKLLNHRREVIEITKVVEVIKMEPATFEASMANLSGRKALKYIFLAPFYAFIYLLKRILIKLNIKQERRI